MLFQAIGTYPKVMVMLIKEPSEATNGYMTTVVSVLAILKVTQ